MKKNKFLSLLLCLLLVLGSFPVSAQATEVTEPGTDTGLADMPTQPQEIPFGSVCVQNGCRTIEGMVPLAGSGVLLDTAQSAFLYEITTGTVVYSYNPDFQVAPGTLTKLVNAVIVLQYCDLDDKVTLTSEIHKIPAGSLSMGLKTGEELTVKDLLYCMLLAGCNQSAVALACHVAQNQPTFTTMMNQWVANIGCTGTKFANVHGLDNADCVTTARDMTKIMMAAIKDETLYEIISSLDYKLQPTNKTAKERSFRTLNYMIDQGTIQDFRDTRVKSGVASYVESLGASLVVTAEAKGMTYVAVVLGCERVNEVVDGVESWRVANYGNFNEMTKLIKMGFGNYKVNRIVYDGMALGQFTVANGECNVVGQAEVNIDSVVPIDAQMSNLYMKFDVLDGLSAPIEKDSLIATMQIEYRNSVLAEAEVYAAGNVKVAGKNGVTIHSTAARSDANNSGFLSFVGTVSVIFLGGAAAYLSFNAYMRSRIRARRRKRRAARRRNY